MARERWCGLAAAYVLAVACGGKSNSTPNPPSTAGAVAMGDSGSHAGSGAAAGSDRGGAVGGATAGVATTGTAGTAVVGMAGASPDTCTPGTAPTCADDAVVNCSAQGVLERVACSTYETCLDGACALKDMPLGLEPNEFGFTWRDAYMLLPCYERLGYACLTSRDEVCPQAGSFDQKGVSLRETFAIGGEPYELYQAHLVVNGVVSGKYYEGGVRDAGDAFAPQGEGTDAFYRGGKPIESSYDSWQMTIRDADGKVFAHYYLNAFPQNSGYESHMTARISYEKDVEVPGGGSIEYRVHDSNCQVVENCAFGETPLCSLSFRIPTEEFSSLPESWQGQPLASYDAIGNGQQPFHGQIVHLRVTKIVYAGELEP